MSHHHLSATHREILERMLSLGKSIRSIAKILGYSAAGICKEIQRNKNVKGLYTASAAQYKADFRRHKASKKKSRQSVENLLYIKEKLKLLWSPEQISGRMRVEELNLCVSFSTIYRWIEQDSKWGKKRKPLSGYAQYLRSKSKRRQRKSLGYTVCKSIPDLPRIEERGEDKSFGHWECDLVHGYNRSGYLLTVVERSLGITFIAYCCRKNTESVNKAMTAVFSKIPPMYCKSTTYDRGKEFYGFKEIEKKFGCKSYFCSPHAPYEKGLNENTNGLLRQYFPRGKDFSTITSEDMKKAMISLNHRPRKKFSYKTAVEMMRERSITGVSTFI